MDYAASASPNPSSIHLFGVEARNKLQNARKEVANILYTQPENIIFTSGGTESNNLAIIGIVEKYLEIFYPRGSRTVLGEGRSGKKFQDTFRRPHIITTNIEHPSVLETFKLLEKRKLAQISIVPVEPNGIVDPKKIKKEIKENTVLVSVMYANNEIGTIEPIKEIAKEIRHYKKETKEILETWEHDGASTRNFLAKKYPYSKIPFVSGLPFFHTDAVQAVNYLDINVEKLGVDLLSLSGSKIEGGGRVGILYKRKTVPLVNIFGGGDQEMGLRPGTENLPEILKFSIALKLTNKIKEKEGQRLTKLRDYFFKKLPKEFILNGDLNSRLPNNINITIPKIPSDLLVIELSVRGVMVSSKSACKSSSKDGSYVIKAIHPEIDRDIGGLRFSLGRDTTKSDIDYTIRSLSIILKKLKKWYD